MAPGKPRKISASAGNTIPSCWASPSPNSLRPQYEVLNTRAEDSIAFANETQGITCTYVEKKHSASILRLALKTVTVGFYRGILRRFECTDVSKELVFGVITSDLVCFALGLVSFLELSQSVCPVDGKLCG